MQLVVDASVVVKWIFADEKREQHTTSAVDVLHEIREGAVGVLQPPHWLAEVAAVVARLDPGSAAEAVRLLYAMEFPVLAEPEMYTTACELSAQLGHHVFDTLYHAVALHRPPTLLLTADEQYYRKAHRIGSLVRLREFRLN